MRICELVNGYYYMITNEQKEFFDILKGNDKYREELTERQQRLAEEMTGLGIINREYDEEGKKVIYRIFERE
jgi:hypothetical protein